MDCIVHWVTESDMTEWLSQNKSAGNLYLLTLFFFKVILLVLGVWWVFSFLWILDPVYQFLQKKKMLDFDWDCFNFINNLRKNWHFNNIESLDSWTGYSSSFVQAFVLSGIFMYSFHCTVLAYLSDLALNNFKFFIPLHKIFFLNSDFQLFITSIEKHNWFFVYRSYILQPRIN